MSVSGRRGGGQKTAWTNKTQPRRRPLASLASFTSEPQKADQFVAIQERQLASRL